MCVKVRDSIHHGDRLPTSEVDGRNVDAAAAAGLVLGLAAQVEAALGLIEELLEDGGDVQIFLKHN